MKAHYQQSNASSPGENTKSGCDKMQSLKASAYINKSSGNMAAKRRKGADFSPFESHNESKTASKTGGLMEAPSRYAKMLSARPPNHSGKIKLQLFPIDETIQEIMQQEKHNPYLELTLAPRKKMSSIVQHLNTKWGSSQCAKGELILFSNDTRLDTIGGSAKWTIEDSCTAADVHVTVGSPSTFRLRYGWFGPELKQPSSEPSLASAHSTDKTICSKPPDLVFNEQKHMACSGESPNNFVASAHSTDKTIDSKPPDLVFNEQKHMAGSGESPNNFVTPSVNKTNTSQVVDNPSNVAPLSWLDSISNISFGALLSEAAPSQDSKQPPSQNNTYLQQIPVTCDSFDAAIASLIACQQPSNQPKVSNPSLWEAEETCHAFPFQNQTSQASSSVPGNSISTITSSVLCAIPETGTDDQQCATDGRKEELNGQTSVLDDDINAKPDISMHESAGDPEPGASCPRLLSGTDSIGLSCLLTDSLDAFQKFSVF